MTGWELNEKLYKEMGAGAEYANSCIKLGQGMFGKGLWDEEVDEAIELKVMTIKNNQNVAMALKHLNETMWPNAKEVIEEAKGKEVSRGDEVKVTSDSLMAINSLHTEKLSGEEVFTVVSEVAPSIIGDMCDVVVKDDPSAKSWTVCVEDLVKA